MGGAPVEVAPLGDVVVISFSPPELVVPLLLLGSGSARVVLPRVPIVDRVVPVTSPVLPSVTSGIEGSIAVSVISLGLLVAVLVLVLSRASGLPPSADEAHPARAK